MPGQTTSLHLRYPLPSEGPDGPGGIQTLAQDIDALNQSSAVGYENGCADRDGSANFSSVTRAGALGLLIVNAKAGTGDLGSSTAVLHVPDAFIGTSWQQSVQGTVRTTAGTVDVYFLNGILVVGGSIPANSFILGTLPYRFV